MTFTSNFFFWFQTGYFDHAAVEKPLLHTWSLAVEEQFYLALPILLWGLLRSVRGSRIALPAVLGALTLASFALSIWLMKTDRSATAFFMSPPRAWEFLIGGLVATPGFPVLRHALAQQIARGVALVLIAIPIFSLRQGPGFPGFNALAPCIGAAMFIWSGIGVPTRLRRRFSPLNVARFFGQISYSLYLWHWPLFTFARFSKSEPGAGCHRQGRAVRADGRDLLFVVAICRAAVPRADAGADPPRRVPCCRPCDGRAAGRQRRRNVR